MPPDLGERQNAAVAANVLGRTFEAPAPNRKWIADFTHMGRVPAGGVGAVDQWPAGATAESLA